MVNHVMPGWGLRPQQTSKLIIFCCCCCCIDGGGSSASHPSRGAGHDVEEGQEEGEEVEETTTLKVVHFGMV